MVVITDVIQVLLVWKMVENNVVRLVVRINVETYMVVNGIQDNDFGKVKDKNLEMEKMVSNHSIQEVHSDLVVVQDVLENVVFLVKKVVFELVVQDSGD